MFKFALLVYQKQSCRRYQLILVSEYNLFVSKIIYFHPVEIFKTLKGEDLAVSYQSVARIINKLKLTGSTNNLPRSGRPRKINAEAQAFIEEQMRRNDETTSREIQKKLAKHGLIVHASTI